MIKPVHFYLIKQKWHTICSTNFMPYKQTRKLIKKLRTIKGISQKEMAERLFMDERSYRRIENDEKKSLDPVLLIRICEALGLDKSFLLNEIIKRS